ncbi:penicillin acylase family protein [Roseomonas sp. NAR14]|uniref:Penicillin acylase family protein n=1 Tax=Roseomonas acroporae TaxID=2937791 RepID=A0A9X1Y5I8_9PROT|nr:penicillin acylase family protein [Roseomonas acroporae]MCK8783876.1 penicillin acylase family protein [Roseomonas acroporae]
MRKPFRLLRRILAGAAALLLLVPLAAAGLLWWTLPAGRGSLALPGLGAPVEIALDEAGIPTVRAASARDAALAMGWLHARDRLFEMETMRRGAAGRLAEMVGPAALRGDRFTRTLGLARRAEADLAALPAETRALLEAYAAGVNAWIAARGRFAAPEFLALGAPAPWRPADSLLWGKVMGLWLSGHWRVDLERGRLAALLPPARLADLWPEDRTAGRPDRHAAGPPPGAGASTLAGLAAPAAGPVPTPLPDPAAAARLLAALPRFPADAPLPDSASNAWAVSGRRAAGGAPLLAADPHLGFGAPILWYLARIELPGETLQGATSPGVPFVVIGRNRRVAWGFTITGSDTQDVFVERVTAGRPDHYDTPEGPRPFAVREEVIHVRGGPDETLRVRETRHGPVLSDLDAAAPGGGQGEGGSGGTVLAVAMANLASPDSAAAGLHALNRAGSVAEARAAASLIASPPQNLMVADSAGRIALYLTGRVPLRRGGDGSLPVPGWDGGGDWLGWVPFDSLPHVEDPGEGMLANANNRVAPPDAAAFLGRDWFGDWRFRRIGALLAARPRHDAAGFAAMQMDSVSLLARDLQPVLRAAPRPAGAAGAARDLLLAWDGAADPDRPQPLIFNAWWRAMIRALLRGAGLPEGTAGGGLAGPEFLRLVLTDAAAGARWCGDAGCAALAAAVLEETVGALQEAHGQDPATWRWGAVHVARFEHPVLRFVPLLGRWTSLSAVTGGDGETVNRGAMTGLPPAPFRHVHGAGLRAVFDLARPDAALLVIATGQSGHPLSPHWGDLLARWRDGAMLTPGGGGTAFRLLPRARPGPRRMRAARRRPEKCGNAM